MIYEAKFLMALGITSIVEAPVVFCLAKWVFKVKDAWKILAVAVLASVVTLPYLWFVLPPFVDARLYLWIGEGFAVAVETVLYAYFLKLRIDRAFMVSFVANMISYFLGKFIS